MNNNKPRILIIPNVSYWIVGEMARHIQTCLRNQFDIVVASEIFLDYSANEFKKLVNSCDLIHAMNESSLPLLLDHSDTNMPPIITWIHHFTTWSSLHQLAIENSAAITACTETWQNLISQRCQLPVYTVLHGVDTTFFARKPNKKYRKDIPEDHFVVGFVASKGSDKDGERKGVDTLIKVLIKLGEKIPKLAVCFTTNSWTEEIAYFNSIGIKAYSSGFIPRRNMPKYYNSIDALLVTATVEGGPVTVLESMACGTPVVSTKVGLVEYIVKNGHNGFAADIGNVEGLVDSLFELHNDLSLRNRIAQQARKDMLNKDWCSELNILNNIYSNFLEKKPSTLDNNNPFTHPTQYSAAARAAETIIIAYRSIHKNKLSFSSLRQIMSTFSGLGFIDIIRGLKFIKH